MTPDDKNGDPHMTNEAQELIWAKVVPDWHDGETGEDFVGGEFDAGLFKDGVEYIRKDLSDAAIAELVEGLGILADCVDDGCFASEMEMATVMDNARALIAKYGDKT